MCRPVAHLIVACFLAAALWTPAQGCHSAEDGGDNYDDDDFRRKKRQAEDPAEAEVRRTTNLREFFTNCLRERMGDIWSWGSVIDVTILDSTWYFNSAGSYCSTMGERDSGECWKGRLDQLLNNRSTLMGPARECIDQYVANTTGTPAVDVRSGRKKRHILSSKRHILSDLQENGAVRVGGRLGRMKRQAPPSARCTSFFPNAPIVRMYGSCSQNNVRMTPGRQDVDFPSVSQFIADDVICAPEITDCGAGGEETLSRGDLSVPDWPYRFEAITRQGSMVRSTVTTCNNLVFPLDTDTDDACQEWSAWSACICGPGRRRFRRRVCPERFQGETEQLSDCDENNCFPSFIQILRQILLIRSQTGVGLVGFG